MSTATAHAQGAGVRPCACVASARALVHVYVSFISCHPHRSTSRHTFAVSTAPQRRTYYALRAHFILLAWRIRARARIAPGGPPSSKQTTPSRPRKARQEGLYHVRDKTRQHTQTHTAMLMMALKGSSEATRNRSSASRAPSSSSRFAEIVSSVESFSERLLVRCLNM